MFCAINVSAQRSEWKTDKKGWVLRKEAGSSKFQKFFAIGIWGVPGYKYFRNTDKNPSDNNENKNIFLNNSKDFNIVIMQSGYERPFMNDIIKMTGTAEFPWTFIYYLDREMKGQNAYTRMQALKKSNSTQSLNFEINKTIDSIARVMKGGDYIWSPIDEVANGRGWNWPVNIVENIYRSIKRKEPKNLVYTDLMGTGKGNTFLFEENYLREHKELPNNPPYHALKPEDMGYKKDSLLGFNRAYDGSPQYEFKNGSYAYKQYEPERLKKLWFENVKRTAAGYKNGGDAFGVNAFLDFSQYPVLSGITVDAVKAGIKKGTPVWLYFDGNGYARGKMSIEAYTKMVKCQIYTSLVHGATGIMFWSDLNKDIANFNALVPVVEQVKKDQDVFKLKTKLFKADGDLHYMVKKGGSKKYLIATNTSKTETKSFNLKNKNYVLNPLEVYISEL